MSPLTKIKRIGILLPLLISVAAFTRPPIANAAGPGGSCPKNHIDTAIGCVSFATEGELAKDILTWGIGISGGIALFFIIYASFLISTSSGDPKKIQAGKELMTAAITGLLLLILSTFILRVIGVDILKLPL